ncbi:hypothetical protein BGY98DRAFT_1010835 [Russula aff. rugulosa BPL654]|nr:hypothetical protein BGY98DRAFT_1010835 [Russula aff. rugulosa BPL654]
MYLPFQEPFLDELLRTADSHSHNQNTSAYVGDESLSHGYEASFENFTYDACPASQEEKPTIMPSLGYHAMPSISLPRRCGSLATSPGVNAKTPTTEAMDVKQGQYNVIHSVAWSHRHEQTGDQIGEPRIYDRRFTCTFNNCGKSFSGEWEKTRHMKSIHGPPTIGCRVCNYKQSRKDLFSEHCRKRHPGESIEELMVHLVHNNGISP